MGPRQVGKTTLAQSLAKESAYYNYDIKKDLRVFRDQNWDYSKKLIIFDELHKMKKWKLWLKSLYDEGLTKKQNFLITGSARLDISKKMGDSLAGRFFSLRLNPLDLNELFRQ
jgi:predicted AAA+ superfamily ATPase